MRDVLAIAGAVIRDAVRRKLLWVVVLFVALMAVVAPSLPSYGVGVVVAVYREVSIALTFAAAFVVCLALATTRLPQEIERRTVFNVLVRDVSRWRYLAGTWLGVFAVSGVAVLSFTVVTIAIGSVHYHAPMFRLLEAALGVWLEMGVIAAFAVFMTSRYGTVTAAVGTLAFVFIGHFSATIIPADAAWAGWVPSLTVFDVINPVAHGSGYTALYGLGMVGAAIAWVGALLEGAALLFEGRDL